MDYLYKFIQDQAVKDVPPEFRGQVPDNLGQQAVTQVAEKAIGHVQDLAFKDIPPELRSQVPDNLGQQVIVKLAEEVIETGQAIEAVVNSTLPGAASPRDPYKHVPGTTPHESLLLSAMLLDLKDSSILQGLCQRTDGKWEYAEIDLNNHYANKLGEFASGGSGFKHTGRNLKLEATESTITFKGELAQPEGRGWLHASADLSVCILVKNARFVFEKHDGFWDRDGFLARHSEGIPVVGFITAAIQNITDNEDHAHRALARCTNSTIVTVAAIAGGFGGPAGAALASGLATPIAIIAESHIVKTIDDPRLRDEFQEATIGRAICESLTNMVGGAAGGYTSQYIGQWLSKYGASLVGKVAVKGLSSAASTGAKAGTKAGYGVIDAASEAIAIQLVSKVAQVMKGNEGPLKEWTKVQESLEAKYGKP